MRRSTSHRAGPAEDLADVARAVLTARRRLRDVGPDDTAFGGPASGYAYSHRARPDPELLAAERNWVRSFWRRASAPLARHR